MFNSALKTLAAAAVISATGAAAFASGSDHIYLANGQRITSHLEIDLVRASSNGTVEIYTYHRNVQGELLASKNVHAGANKSLDFRLKKIATTDLLAVLTVNGVVVDSVEIDNQR
jgi:hypothetical protein